MSVSVGDMSHIAALTDPSPSSLELYVYGVQRSSGASGSPLQMWEDAMARRLPLSTVGSSDENTAWFLFRRCRESLQGAIHPSTATLACLTPALCCQEPWPPLLPPQPKIVPHFSY